MKTNTFYDEVANLDIMLIYDSIIMIYVNHNKTNWSNFKLVICHLNHFRFRIFIFWLSTFD